MKINYYRSNGEWCYAAFVNGEFDHSDQVGLPDSATEKEVKEHLASMFNGCTVERVGDI